VNLDGEIATCTPTLFQILPGAVEVFAPDALEGGGR
jgi:diacylglycerol kinase family enzyme